MNRLDTIIDALEHCKGLTQIDRMHLKKALAAARSLRAMKPEGISPINGAFLYVLDDEVTK